jgi:nicotinamidase-related amidase
MKFLTRHGIVEEARAKGIPLALSRVEKDAAAGKLGKPDARYGKVHLYTESTGRAYIESLIKATDDVGAV